MSAASRDGRSEPGKGSPLFKWVCLLVGVVALTAYGWMLNDIRLEVKGLAPKVERLTQKTEELVEKTDKQLPRILAQAERVSSQLDRHLPPILAQTQEASKTINTHLPTLLNRSETLLAHAEVAVDKLAHVADSFEQYKGLMGVVHAASQNKGLFGYGMRLLSFLGGQSATIGVKKPGQEALQRAVPAKQWASTAQKDAHFLSLIAKTKDEVLHGLARTGSSAPLHIQVGSQPPRLLADWLKESHPESKGLE